jgi:DNA polymerase (family 10)
VARGISIAIDPDAHSVADLEGISYGLGIARKGWVTAAATLNAKSAPDFESWLARRRPGAARAI